MFSRGDIYHLSYDNIKIVLKKHSRDARNKRGLVKAWSVPLPPQLPL